ncbi:hypothetical protein BDM02DRAFT_3187652 [Thelephora ganbajun]|uniref:Uncharacterized protein n=1 Tax=Thelephora ganbajun TaxID=370292 RepID=A0ACB6ZDY9_THEGA|nr:hypothetical protein BDM02DRAFT_3187652 [Thelephora ganbajun]
MPQIYHYPPQTEEGSSPETSDADDEIVLSDLVRTGEASRLRRRGAMRIDHTAREGGSLPPSQPPGNHHPPEQAMQTADFVPNVDTIWGQDQDGGPDEEYSPDSYTGEWPETRDTQNDDLDYPEDLEKSTHSFVLYCGAEGPHPPPTTPHFISPLPAYPLRPPPSRTSPTSNGCGVIIHTAAVPRKRCGVWMARFGSTDAVVEMDSQYFDRSVVVRMMKSPCGCVREGVGCRFCGNPLGTRYRPCKAAAEGLFSTAITPSHPNHPSGSAYWRNPPSPSSVSTCFIYTLFSDRVSSFPPLSSTSYPMNVRSIPHSAAEQPSGLQPPAGNTTTYQPRPSSEFDADGNPIGESANNSPDKVIEAWSGR